MGGTLTSARVIERAKKGQLVDGSGATCDELEKLIAVDKKAIKFEKDKLEARAATPRRRRLSRTPRRPSRPRSRSSRPRRRTRSARRLPPSLGLGTRLICPSAVSQITCWI